MPVSRFRLKEQSIREYLDILNKFYHDQNHFRLAGNIQYWSKKNGKDPHKVYHYQMKIFNWR